MVFSWPGGSARDRVRLERVAANEVACVDDGDAAQLDQPLARVFDAAAAAGPEREFLVSSVRPDET